jgi:hypothetical protein
MPPPRAAMRSIDWSEIVSAWSKNQNPCFRQKKSELRKGDRITLFHLLKGRYLDELAAAGGDGTDIMRRIKRRAVLVRNSRN